MGRRGGAGGKGLGAGGGSACPPRSTPRLPGETLHPGSGALLGGFTDEATPARVTGPVKQLPTAAQVLERRGPLGDRWPKLNAGTGSHTIRGWGVGIGPGLLPKLLPKLLPHGSKSGRSGQHRPVR